MSEFPKISVTINKIAAYCDTLTSVTETIMTKDAKVEMIITVGTLVSFFELLGFKVSSEKKLPSRIISCWSPDNLFVVIWAWTSVANFSIAIPLIVK